MSLKAYNHSTITRIICIILIQALLVFGTGFAADSRDTSAVAPPLATKPIDGVFYPGEIVYNETTGECRVVTNYEVIESWDRETVRSVRQGETPGKSFRNRWVLADLSILIGQMLKLAKEHKIQSPAGILKSLIKQHIRNRKGEAEMLLEDGIFGRYEVDRIEEIRQGGEITGFSLPVAKDGTTAHRLIFNFTDGDFGIPMKDGTYVCMRVESADLYNTANRIRDTWHDLDSVLVSINNLTAYSKDMSLQEKRNRWKNIISRLKDIRTAIYSKNRAELEKAVRSFTEIAKDLMAIMASEEIVSLRDDSIGTLRDEDDLSADKIKELAKGFDISRYVIRLILTEFIIGDDEKRKPFSLSQVIDAAIRIALPDVMEEKIAMRISSDTQQISCYESKLFRIILNLLKNAADFTGGMGKITIDASRQGDAIVLKVSDDGPGMPEEKVNAFNADRPVESSKGESGGRGLNIVRRMVKDHNGTIKVESTTGKGTTFMVRLPIKTSKGSERTNRPGVVTNKHLSVEDRLKIVDQVMTRIEKEIKEEKGDRYFGEDGNYQYSGTDVNYGVMVMRELQEKRLMTSEKSFGDVGAGIGRMLAYALVSTDVGKVIGIEPDNYLREKGQKAIAELDRLGVLDATKVTWLPETWIGAINTLRILDSAYLYSPASSYEGVQILGKEVRKYMVTNAYLFSAGSHSGWGSLSPIPKSQLQSETASLPARITVESERPTIAVTGFGEQLGRIVASEEFPAEKLYLDGIVDWIDQNRPDLFNGAGTREEKTIKVCLGILSGAELLRFFDTAKSDLQYKTTQNEVAKRRSLVMLEFEREVWGRIKALEDVNLPEGRRTARFISQPFGYGYDNIASLGFDPANRMLKVTKEFLELCLHPERRKFVGQWERDYAETLSRMSARELEDEWKRLGGPNALYTLNVREFIGDTCQHHPAFFMYFEEINILQKGQIGDDNITHFIYSIAKMDVYLEWALRHWGEGGPDRTIQSLPARVEPSLEYIREGMTLPQRRDGTRLTFEETGVYRTLTTISDNRALEILRASIPASEASAGAHTAGEQTIDKGSIAHIFPQNDYLSSLMMHISPTSLLVDEEPTAVKEKIFSLQDQLNNGMRDFGGMKKESGDDIRTCYLWLSQFLRTSLTAVRELVPLLSSDSIRQYMEEGIAEVESFINGIDMLMEESEKYVDVNSTLQRILDITFSRYYTNRERTYHIHKQLSPDIPSIFARQDEIAYLFFSLVLPLQLVWEVTLNASTRLTSDNGKQYIEVMMTTPQDISLKNVITGKGKDTGIGLALAEIIVRKYGGTIKVESLPGKGTTLTVRLPAGAEDDIQGIWEGRTTPVWEENLTMEELKRLLRLAHDEGKRLEAGGRLSWNVMKDRFRQIFTSSIINAASKREELSRIDWQLLKRAIAGEVPLDEARKHLYSLAAKANEDSETALAYNELKEFLMFVYNTLFEAELHGYRHHTLYGLDMSNLFRVTIGFILPYSRMGTNPMPELDEMHREGNFNKQLAQIIGRFWDSFDNNDIEEAAYWYRLSELTFPYYFKLLSNQLAALQRNGSITAIRILMNPVSSGNRRLLKNTEIRCQDRLKLFNLEPLLERETQTAMDRSERAHTRGLEDNLNYLQSTAEAPPLIVAVGTGWMKGYEEGRYMQYDALNPLISNMRNCHEFRNARFIVEDDKKLCASIKAKMAEKGFENARVIALAGEETINKDLAEFDTGRNVLVGVDNTEMTIDTYIRLMEMLKIASMLAIAPDVPPESPNIPMAKRGRFWVFTPRFEPYDYEIFRIVYETQKFA